MQKSAHPLPENVTQPEANQFIVYCHMNFEAVKQQVGCQGMGQTKMLGTTLEVAESAGYIKIADLLKN